MAPCRHLTDESPPIDWTSPSPTAWRSFRFR